MYATYGPMLLMLANRGGRRDALLRGRKHLGKKHPTADKMKPFECGSESSGGRHVKLSVKFYLTAILFVVFDIESVFIYPWAVHFRDLGWTGSRRCSSSWRPSSSPLSTCGRKGALEWET